jgi:transposase-like protein
MKNARNFEIYTSTKINTNCPDCGVKMIYNVPFFNDEKEFVCPDCRSAFRLTLERIKKPNKEAIRQALEREGITTKKAKKK